MRSGRTDIPLFVGFARASQGEAPAMMEAMAHFLASLDRHLPELRVKGVVADAAYDAAGFYRWVGQLRIDPIVARHSSYATIDAVRPRASDGTTPLCEGGIAMKRHTRQDDSLTWRCPAMCLRRGPDGTKKWTFDASVCPLGRTCTGSPRGPFLTMALSDNPRLNLPVSRESEEYAARMRERTAVERHFSHLHHSLRDRTYRRRHLWQIGCMMHALARQMDLVRERRRAELDALWERLFPPGPRQAA